MLNEIMDRSMSKFSESSEDTGAQPDATGPAEVSRETPGEEKPSSPPQRNKPSSVYIYLAVLFGAAFFMLLLAYFVQRRNSVAVQDDLRITSASREELLENIQRLEKESLDLRQGKEALEAQLAELQRQTKDSEIDSFWREKDLLNQLASWYDFWDLEMSFQAENFEECAEFFRNVYSSNYYLTPETETAQRRIRLIYETLLDLGYLAEEDSHVFVPPEVTGAPGQ